MPLSIRPARPTDLTDFVAWNAAMAWETERRQLDRDILQRGVAGVFEQPQRGFYLVAERDGEAVGGLLVSTRPSPCEMISSAMSYTRGRPADGPLSSRGSSRL